VAKRFEWDDEKAAHNVRKHAISFQEVTSLFTSGVGGTDDVMRLVDCLDRADVSWCCIGGVAVHHWAEERISPPGTGAS